MDLSFTDSATYQLGVVLSADSLFRADDAVHPAGDYRFFPLLELQKSALLNG